MKHFFNDIYGKEVHWFRRLTLLQQISIVYFCISFCLLMLAACSGSMVLCVLAVLNLGVSLGKLSNIPIDKLEE